MNKMSDMDTGDAARELVQEYALDAPPEKVWRALSIPELRAQWTCRSALAPMAARCCASSMC